MQLEQVAALTGQPYLDGYATDEAQYAALMTAGTIVADTDITMFAGRNLTIESAQNTQSGSQVASLQGDVTLVAGGTYRQTASSVMALGQAGPLVGGDVNVLAKTVVINEAFDTGNSSTQARSASTVLGGSASVGGISTDTLRGSSNTVKAMNDSGDPRMQALGVANLAMQGQQAYDTAAALASGGVGYKVSVNVSRNKSQSQSTTQASQAVGSSIVGANNVNLIATGGGTESNIHAVGSTIAAGDTVNMAADNAIRLEASQNSWAQQGTNKSSGASIGVGYAVGAQNGFTIELGMSQGKGSDNGSEISHNNTHVSGGKAVNVISGGDLTLKGAVIDAPRVTADVGGKLSIESLQDTSSQVSKQNSSGLNASLCIPPICYGVSTVSGSVAAAKANGSFASVTEQSGIKAGDGGFDVSVKGRTDLKGGVISSTQAAIDGKKNSFTTASLATSDIENHSTYKASGYSVSGSVSGALGDQSTATSAGDKAAAKNAAANSRPGGSAGVGSASGSQTSTTKAGISGVAGDATVRSDDTVASTGALVKNWDTTSLIKDVQGQAQITQEFGQRAAYQIGTYADKKYNELKNSDPAEAAKWAEGGEYRVAAHAASGLLAGGVGGALGAGASASLMPRIGEAIADMGLPAPVAQAVGAATAAAIGAAAGGGAGAASAYNVDVNNRQLHPTELQALKGKAKDFAERLRSLGYSEITEERALAILVEQTENRIDYTQAMSVDTNALNDQVRSEAQKFVNTLGSSLGSYDDGRGHQINYFPNTTANGERLLGDYRNSNINALPHMPPVDYVTLQGGIFGLNGGVSINVLNGEIFIGGAKTNLSTTLGGSAVVGRVLGGSMNAERRPDEVSNMLGGGSFQAGLCLGGFCGGINQSIGQLGSNPPTAIEFGFGTPGGGVGGGASVRVK